MAAGQPSLSDNSDGPAGIAAGSPPTSHSRVQWLDPLAGPKTLYTTGHRIAQRAIMLVLSKR